MLAFGFGITIGGLIIGTFTFIFMLRNMLHVFNTEDFDSMIKNHVVAMIALVVSGLSIAIGIVIVIWQLIISIQNMA